MPQHAPTRSKKSIVLRYIY